MLWTPPRPARFPYTTLFRSCGSRGGVEADVGEEDDRRALQQAGEPELAGRPGVGRQVRAPVVGIHGGPADRKSTRLNSSHVKISYAVFCLKKKQIKYIADAT